MSKQNKRVLIIEDEPTLQSALTRTLKDEGFEPLSAYDGVEGIEKAKEEKPDVILLDIVLPKKDGFTVARTLNEDTDTKHIPVIALTNLGAPEDIERMLECGVKNYLVKSSHSLEEVAQKIKEVLAE